MAEQRDGFLFYRSFYEAVKELNKRDKTAVILAICDYALNGVEPSLSGSAASVWILIKPILDANQRRYQNGKKGGRPKTGTEPNSNQSESEPKGNKTTRQQGIKEPEIKQQDNTPGGAPSLSEIENFCLGQGGTSAAAAEFYSQYSRAGWQANGQPIENWRGLLTNYLRSGGGQGGQGAVSTASHGTTDARKSIERMRQLLEQTGHGGSVPPNARKNAEWMRRMLDAEEAENDE